VTDQRFHQVAELFRDASARDPAERSAFLDEACGTDGVLRREVDSLLAIDAVEAAKTIVANRAPDGATSIPGTIGAYEVIEEIGRGGMGDDRFDRGVDAGARCRAVEAASLALSWLDRDPGAE
jgi:hypothetical protein